MTAVLIPAYRPDKRLTELVKALKSLKIENIITVDDGSGEAYREVFDDLRLMDVKVLSHEVNRGKGAALKTGISFVTSELCQCQAVITADADGQHTPEDIKKLCNASNDTELILGVRELSSPTVPFRSRLGNRISCIAFKLITGKSCPDTQTGLRAIPRALFELALDCDGERYDYEMNFLTLAADLKVPMKFIPIKTVYHGNNSTSHFRPIRDSLRVYKKPLRFLSSSLLCAVVDIVLFAILNHFIKGMVINILFPTVAARLVSGALNFTLNKKWSFSSKGRTSSELVRYLMLFTLQMFLSFALVWILSSIPLPQFLWKIPVDAALFFLSYTVQRRWVYSKEGTDK